MTGVSAGDRALMFRTILKLVAVSAIVALASAAFAQQNGAPGAQPAPVASQPAPQGATAPQTPASAAASAQSAPAEVSTDSTGTAARPVAFQVPREMSPWSMFKSADIIVQAVM